MLLGADPDDLDGLATTHEVCAAHLARVRVRLRAAGRGAWSGPVARRWWAALDTTIIPALVSAGNASAAAARRLRSEARGQRRASLPPVASRTVHRDPTGDGRWIGRVGPADASVVMLLVPGVGTDRSDLPRLRADAERVWQVTAAHGGSGEVFGASAVERIAVWSWLGYDPPDHLLLGIDSRAAAAGAPALARLVTGLQERGARVVVVGHSYGALVATGAEAGAMDADELVLLGAPGLGVPGSEHLRLAPESDLWAATARLDPIALVARAGLLHGPDPATVARSLPTSLPGHGAYLSDPVLLDALAALSLEGVALEGSGVRR